MGIEDRCTIHGSLYIQHHTTPHSVSQSVTYTYVHMHAAKSGRCNVWSRFNVCVCVYVFSFFFHCFYIIHSLPLNTYTERFWWFHWISSHSVPSLFDSSHRFLSLSLNISHSADGSRLFHFSSSSNWQLPPMQSDWMNANCYSIVFSSTVIRRLSKTHNIFININTIMRFLIFAKQIMSGHKMKMMISVFDLSFPLS